MIGWVLLAALLAALIAMGSRRARRARLRRLAADRLGSSPARAIAIRDYAEIEEHLATRWCVCGGYLERRGEGTRDADARRLRVARLRCQECEAEDEVFFDTTDVLQ